MQRLVLPLAASALLLAGCAAAPVAGAALDAIDARYAKIAEADDARVKEAQFSLDSWDKAQANAARNNGN